MEDKRLNCVESALASRLTLSQYSLLSFEGANLRIEVLKNFVCLNPPLKSPAYTTEQVKYSLIAGGPCSPL